jgi:putative aldouronate transport system permease protein
MKARKNGFDILIYAIILVILFVTVFPFWQMLVIVTSSVPAFLKDNFHIIPRSFNVSTFLSLFENDIVLNGIKLSFIVTSAGWAYSMFLTTIGAYTLSKKDILARKFLFNFVIFTMFFGGGIIPLYITVRSLHMTDTVFALFIPGALNTFNLLLMKNYFQSLPDDFEEAARIDGYNDIQILYKIIIPISKPVIAAVSLFYIVGYWNDYLTPTLFASNPKLYPLPLILRNVVVSRLVLLNSAAIGTMQPPSQQYYMSMVLVSLVPVVVLYPFIQKYFVTGIMMGAIKA